MIMVLVTACLILRLIHHWFFAHTEQSQLKIKSKLQQPGVDRSASHKKRDARSNNDLQCLLLRELQSVRDVLEMRETELRKLRKLIDREKYRESSSKLCQTNISHVEMTPVHSDTIQEHSLRGRLVGVEVSSPHILIN